MRPALGVVSLGIVSGPITVDASRGNIFTMTAVADTTIAVKSVRAGAPCVVIVTCGNEGATVTWNGAGGQTVTGFTTASEVQGTQSAFVLWGTANDMSTVYATTNPIGGGGSVTSEWETLTVKGSVLERTEPVVHAGAGLITIDFALSDFHIVGPLVNDVTLTFDNVRDGHDYALQVLQASSGESSFTVSYEPIVPIVGDMLGLGNDAPDVIGSSMIRLYKATGTTLWIVGGDNFNV